MSVRLPVVVRKGSDENHQKRFLVR